MITNSPLLMDAVAFTVTVFRETDMLDECVGSCVCELDRRQYDVGATISVECPVGAAETLMNVDCEGQDGCRKSVPPVLIYLLLHRVHAAGRDAHRVLGGRAQFAERQSRPQRAQVEFPSAPLQSLGGMCRVVEE